VHKVQYINQIKNINSSEARAAELALLRKQPREADNILLGANLFYRAIKMHIDLFNWERALELALKYKTHVDTVLFFRAKYLKNLGRFEGNKKFIQYSEQVLFE
jgi:intraflagellar transport protein 80